MRFAVVLLVCAFAVGCVHPAGTDRSLAPVVEGITVSDSALAAQFSVDAPGAVQVAAYLVVGESSGWSIQLLGVSDSGVSTWRGSLARALLTLPRFSSPQSFVESETAVWYCAGRSYPYVASQDVTNVTPDCVRATLTNLRTASGGFGGAWGSSAGFVVLVGTSEFQPVARWVGADQAVGTARGWAQIQTRLAKYLFDAHAPVRWGMWIRRVP